MHRAIVVGLVLLAASQADAQVTCNWTDNPIVAGQTPIKAEHINELRACIEGILGGGGGTIPPVDPPVDTGTPWRASGTGANIIDMPERVTRIRITGEYQGSSAHFGVWCGSPGDRGGLLVNETLGTLDQTRYEGIHTARRTYGGAGEPCRELEINGTGVRWSITETAPRRASGTGSLAGDEDAERRALERLQASPKRN